MSSPSLADRLFMPPARLFAWLLFKACRVRT